MGDPLPDPAALVLLADIADAGSLTTAARAAGTTQPAVSRQLKRLEDALGVPLFERGVRGVQPTEEGAALLPRARTIRHQLRLAAEDMAQRRGRREGQIVVAVSHFAAIVLLPRVLPAFRQRWPAVRLHIVPPRFEPGGLREGAPDFAVMSLPAQRLASEYVERAVYTTRVVAVARPGHPLVRARSLRELAGAEWVLPNPQGSVARGLLLACRRARLAPPQCPVACETLTGLEMLVAHSDLIGAVPLEVHQARASASGLLALPLGDAIEGPRVAILRWADARPTPAAADLEEAFVAAAHALARRRRSG